ncbi:MAG: CPBP family glutamic-type intramembrane protease [Candidatus Korarchaeum sp.]|nr:CPBP family glutamic-type intramembrane protease [Candidatus Korarchaeum sp.]MDW8093348.1 CPBP family glutamic-type intramembrane protease [Nitrososphaerota archaeon]
MRASAMFFSLFFVLLAVYAMVVIKEEKLADATVKFALILLVSMVVVSVVRMDNFAFTMLTVPVLLLTIAAHYGTAAFSSFLSFQMGITQAQGLQSILAHTMHDIATSSTGKEDPLALTSLALLNGIAEEALFTGTAYTIFHRFTRVRYLAAFITASLFAIYHTQSYFNVSPFFYILNVGKYATNSIVLLSPFVTQLVKCGLAEQEAKAGGGLLGVTLGHAIGNGLILLASYGWL